MFTKRWATRWLGVLCLCALPLAAQAQDADGGGAAAVGEDEKTVLINLPENTNLKALVDFVGARLKLNIIYDHEIDGRKITLKTPNAVPLDSLRDLLDSMLKINGMVMVETDAPGVLRVTTAQNGLGELAGVPLREGEVPPEGDGGPVVSRIYKLDHTSAETAVKALTPFINTSKGASIVPIPAHDLVIITEFRSDFDRVQRMLDLTDQPGREIATRFVPVEHLDASELVNQVTSLLSAQAEIRGQADASTRYALIAEKRSNQLVIAARAGEVDEIEAIVRSLDVSLNLRTQVYRLNVVTPTQLDQIVKELVGENKVGRLYKAVADDGSGFLAITATDRIHQQIKELVDTIDRPTTEERSPIRFYKLQNAEARTVADALNGIASTSDLDSVTIDGLNALPPAGFNPPQPSDSESGSSPDDAGNRGTSEGGSGSQNPVEGVQLLAYEPMNTIIVIAPPNLQPIYERLIQRLDTRRPQVLIEATVVALDTTDDFQLGVEFSRSDSVDGGTLLNFSQFGLTTADPETGELTLSSGLVGFNGALLDADIAEVVIQALQRDVRSSVLTRPSVLVNDNAEGELENLETEPFESVNANAQVATTTLGGELETGTKITVEPSISDGDFLKLKYSIQVSTFDEERITTSSGGTLPPGRNENNVSSEVTIPDGTTIVVGGLTREIDSETIQRVPILGRIPIVEYAFSNRDFSKRKITIFVFLRSRILRDDKFEDLKVLSGTAAGRANLPTDAPASEPVEIR